MTSTEMSDAAMAAQIARTDAFVARLRSSIDEALGAIDDESMIADEQRCSLMRIAETLGAVPYVTLCNLANADVAACGMVLDLIEVRLMCVGAGPTLDVEDAAGFLATFDPLIEVARRRRIH